MTAALVNAYMTALTEITKRKFIVAFYWGINRSKTDRKLISFGLDLDVPVAPVLVRKDGMFYSYCCKFLIVYIA